VREGIRMTVQTDSALNRKSKIPWYVYIVGGTIYIVLAGWLFAQSDSPTLAWICALSAPLGFYSAWGAWRREKHNRHDA
jgi:hypothetical protein